MRSDVRTCRVCGCCDEQACAGGCAWSAADLCTSCPPDAPRLWPITRHHIQAATFEVVAQEVTTGSLSVTHRMVEYPQVVTTIRTQRGEVAEIHVYVGSLEVPAGDIDMIAQLLNEARPL